MGKEIRLHLEQFRKIRIRFGQSIIQLRFAQKHDLDIQRNRFRFQNGCHHAAVIRRRIHRDFPGTQSAFQAFPRRAVVQNVFGFNDQESAVRLMQSPRLDHVEICNQGTELLLAFDTADQVGHDGMFQENDRRAVRLSVFNQNIDLVAAQRPFDLLLGQDINRLFLFGLSLHFLFITDEQSNVFNDILVNGVQIRGHMLDIFIFFLQVINQVFDCELSKFLVQKTGLFALFLFPFGNVADSVFQLLLCRVQFGQNFLLFVLGQFFKRFGAEHFTVAGRGDDQPDRHPQDRNVFAGRIFLNRIEILCFLFAETVFNGFQTGSVLLAFKNGRESDTQFFNQLVHILGEQLCLSGRHAQGGGLIRGREIINIAPVAGRLALPSRLCQNLAHQAGLSRAFGPDTEQVVAVGINVDAEFNRADGLLLPQRRSQIFKIRRCFKRQKIQVSR